MGIWITAKNSIGILSHSVQLSIQVCVKISAMLFTSEIVFPCLVPMLAFQCLVGNASSSKEVCISNVSNRLNGFLQYVLDLYNCIDIFTPTTKNKCFHHGRQKIFQNITKKWYHWLISLTASQKRIQLSSDKLNQFQFSQDKLIFNRLLKNKEELSLWLL